MKKRMIAITLDSNYPQTVTQELMHCPLVCIQYLRTTAVLAETSRQKFLYRLRETKHKLKKKRCLQPLQHPKRDAAALPLPENKEMNVSGLRNPSFTATASAAREGEGNVFITHRFRFAYPAAL